MRLNKFIAASGRASRRGADKLIASGRVTVNALKPSSIGQEVTSGIDVVCLDGTQLLLENKFVYIMLNKPTGYISACSDSRERKTVIDLLDSVEERVFPVGRLDYDTTGLLLLTNDGDFAYKCTHPKHELTKKYFAVVKGILTDEVLNTLSGSVRIDGHKTAGAIIEVLSRSSKRTEVYVTIHEGRNRHIKKLFSLAGCRVSYLKRVAIGDIELGTLPEGKWRSLTESEIKKLI